MFWAVAAVIVIIALSLVGGLGGLALAFFIPAIVITIGVLVWVKRHGVAS